MDLIPFLDLGTRLIATREELLAKIGRAHV